MTIVKQTLCLAVFAAMASCHKTTIKGDTLTATGVLQAQGITTYQYGTHLLLVNPSNTYVLKSALNLNPYIGTRVKITATNTHHSVENGPIYTMLPK